jgi:hypothetical protein
MPAMPAVHGLATVLAQWVDAPKPTNEVNELMIDWTLPEEGSMGVFIWILGAIIVFAVIHFVRTRMRE